MRKSPLETCERALQEQLSFSIDIEDIVYINEHKSARESKTYNGMVTIYKKHMFTCEIPRSMYKKLYIQTYQNGETVYFEWFQV